MFFFLPCNLRLLTLHFEDPTVTNFVESFFVIKPVIQILFSYTTLFSYFSLSSTEFGVIPLFGLLFTVDIGHSFRNFAHTFSWCILFKSITYQHASLNWKPFTSTLRPLALQIKKKVFVTGLILQHCHHVKHIM